MASRRSRYPLVCGVAAGRVVDSDAQPPLAPDAKPAALRLRVRMIAAVGRQGNGLRMLHPKRFEVNEAWIAFRLDNASVRTKRDGHFNCNALMDAASRFIRATEFVHATAAELMGARLALSTR